MDKNLIIRDYTNSDFDSLNALWIETGLGGAQRGDNARIIEDSLNLGGKLIVIENSQTHEIIGSSWMTFDGRRIHLHHIGVKPAYQNKGLGKKLTKESIRFAKKKGYQIKLEVHKDNVNAIKIYKKLGFNYLGDYDVYIIRDIDNTSV
ncbi:MAG: N-acetyltransferase [Bacteroidales bacterium]|jgi:ribosomal protein S18 acetylase RimI-like enzyme|nr:N-acetyltransferase [Bacteroidales bacterium]